MSGKHEITDETYRFFFQCSLDAMLLLDESGKIIDINRSACEAANVSRNEIVGQNFSSLVTPDTRQDFVSVLEKLKTNEVFTGELHLRGKDGHPIPMEWRVRAGALNGFTIWCGRDIGERLNRESKIEMQIKQKDLMLREAHHRMKNNLQFLSSLLNLQANTTEGKMAELLREYSNRIQTIALINGDLTQNGEGEAEIELGAYLLQLAKNLLDVYKGLSERIRIISECDRVMFSVSNAVPCGLILNEIISNSLKYAFENQNEGEIRIVLNQNDKQVNLKISDNGPGLQNTEQITGGKTWGLRLIRMLVKQLNGELEIDNTSGACFRITIPRYMQPRVRAGKSVERVNSAGISVESKA